jgi:hypothetical protein
VDVNGLNLDLMDTTLPAATCTDGDYKVPCEFKSTTGPGGSKTSCCPRGLRKLRWHYHERRAQVFGHVSMGLCANVPLINEIHAEVVFAVKDESGCDPDPLAGSAD